MIKLTGLARISPRLNILRRMSASDDPILSTMSTHLVRDKTARRIGGFFEFIFLVLLPILAVANGVILLMRPGQVFGGSTTAVYLVFRVVYPYLWRAQSAVGLLAYICAFLILVLPGSTLLKREAEGSLFRFVPIGPGEILRAMVKLHAASFLPPIMAYGAYNWFVALLPYPINAYSQVVASVPMVFTDLGWAILVSLHLPAYAILASFTFRQAWAAFLALTVGWMVYTVFWYFAPSYLMTNLTGGSAYAKSGLTFMGMAIALVPLALLLARTAVARRVRPER